MYRVRNGFASRTGVVVAGGCIGLVAVGLQKFGNPANMGICVACFSRDIAGALGLHRAAVVQYLRPEIPGLILGALTSALVFGEFRARAGAMPLIRFLLGALAVIGALVFLGCPWRTALRLAGGDANAVVGLGGLVSGIFIAARLFIAGYDPGPARRAPRVVGAVMPTLALGALLLLVVSGRGEATATSGGLFFSSKGPGAMRAPVWLSLGAGLCIGGLLQRSRFCTIGGIRDLILFRQGHLAWGAVGLVGAALLANLALGQFHPGFREQPIAHHDAVWNFLGMLLAGLAFTLAGGCPGRQCVLAGEGDADAGLFVLGMLVGAAFAHNFGLAATPAGVSRSAQVAVVAGIAICIGLGVLIRGSQPAEES